MATYYWVGGNGTWDASTTTNWSLSSGGAGSAGFPTAADNVIFDANSGASPTVTVTAAVANDCTIGAPTSGTLTFAFGASTLTLAGNFTCNTTISVTGTGTITLSTSGRTFAGNGNTYYNLSFTATGFAASNTITGANTFNNLNISSLASTNSNKYLTVGANQTINGTLTLGTTNSPTKRVVIQSSALGTQRTISVATMATLTDVDFRDIAITGAAAPVSGTRLGNARNNSGIAFVAGVNKYLRAGVAGGSWNQGIWSLTSNNPSGNINNFPLAQDTVVFDDAGVASGSSITLDFPWNIGAIDGSSRTTPMTFATGTINPALYGDWATTSSITLTGTGTLTFAGQGTTQKITAGGATFGQNVTVDNPASTVQLQDNLTVSSARTFTLAQGTLDLSSGNRTLSAGFFSSSNSNARTIAFGTGGIDLTGTAGTIYGSSPVTNMTVTGTPKVRLIAGGAGTRTINAGSPTEAQSISFLITTGSDIISFGSIFVRDVDFTGFTGTCAANLTLYGSLTLSAGMTWTSSGNTQFLASSGNKTFTSAGKSFTGLIFGATGSTAIFQLQDNVTATGTTTLTAGTLALVSRTLSTGLFASTNSNTRAISFGTGNITTTGSGTVWNTGTVTGFSYTGTPTVNISNNSATATTVTTGAMNEAQSLNFNYTVGTYTLTDTAAVYRSVNFTGFTGTIPNSVRTIYGNLTLVAGMTLTAGANATTFASTATGNTITSAGKTQDYPITFNGVGGVWTCQDALTLGSTRALTMTNGTLNLRAGATSTVGSFVTTGTNQKFLGSSTPGTQATISDASGVNSVSYMTIQDSVATGGADWEAYASNNNTDAGNNLNWDFGATPILGTEYEYKLRSFTQPRRF